MVKKLVSHGNSMALIIDKPLLELLKFKPNQALDVTTDGKNLIISPAASEARQLKFKRAMDEIDREHGETFRKLAG